MNSRRIGLIVLALVVVAGVLYVAVFRRSAAPSGLSASGTVEATEAALGFQVPGRIETVRAHEGDRVRTRDTLATLDRTDLLARLAQAQGQVASAQAALAEMVHGARPEELAQAHDADSVAAANLVNAQHDYDRMQALVRENVISQQTFDKARMALDVSRGEKRQADQQLLLVQSGTRPERVTAQRGVVAQAEAEVRQALASLANAVVVAPFDGVITVRNHEPGETVPAGAPVLTMANLADRWVRVYIQEDRIAAIQLNEPATIKTDTYSGRTYTGAVSFISSEAEFTPRNVQTPEERVKLVYAVKVRIVGDSANDLKPGMPADVTLAAITKSP